jgi:hypothetical protein
MLLLPDACCEKVRATLAQRSGTVQGARGGRETIAKSNAGFSFVYGFLSLVRRQFVETCPALTSFAEDGK